MSSALLLLARRQTFTNALCVKNALQQVYNHYKNEFERRILFVAIHSKALSDSNSIVNGRQASQPCYNFVAALYSAVDEKSNIDVRFLVDFAKKPETTLLHKRAHGVLFIDSDKDIEADEFKDISKHFERTVMLDRKDLQGDKPMPQLIMPANSVDVEGAKDAFELEQVKSALIGGTFDCFHSGHKLLITTALLLAQSNFTCGVTLPNMLKNKILTEFIEPIDVRIKSVEDFVNSVDQNICRKIMPITDYFGPSLTDIFFDAIVVSYETRKPTLDINVNRVRRGLNPLDIFIINLVDDASTITVTELEEAKVSSSKTRRERCGRLLRPPKQIKHHDFPDRYLIGLTGGICSGKSHIANYCNEFGATVIDCDKLAHSVYVNGTDCFNRIVAQFGEQIVDAQSNEIDRKKLGSIVFNDRNKLDRLNEIVWPELWENVSAIIRSPTTRSVVVIDAAILVESGWHSRCDEVWTCVITPKEALRRLQSRNNLSKEDAERRLASQTTNEDRVRLTNVFFCSMWEYEKTKAQVKIAWKELQERLPKNLKKT